MSVLPRPAAAPSATGHHHPAGGRHRPSRALVLALALVAGVTVVLSTATEATAATTPAAAGTSFVITGEVVQVQEEDDAYWGEQSDGAAGFRQVGATARYTAADSCADLGSLWGEAAARTGVTQGPGKHLLVLVPNAAHRAGSCADGLGTIGSDAASGGLSRVSDLS